MTYSGATAPAKSLLRSFPDVLQIGEEKRLLFRGLASTPANPLENFPQTPATPGKPFGHRATNFCF
jgi:hypothetical protein